MSISLVSNAYAHKSEVIGDYKIETGWKYEPPIAGKKNYITITIVKASTSDKESTSDNMDHKKMDHGADSHDSSNNTKSHTVNHKSHKLENGISGLAKKFEVDITLNDKKTHLKLFEFKSKPGFYISPYIPYEEGHPAVHLFGKIHNDEIEITFHPEKVELR